MSENIFRNNDLTNYNRAVEEHARAFATEQAKNDAEAEKYNTLKAGILEPIATASLHPTLKSLYNNYVKKGVRNVLGKGKEEAERIGRRAVSDITSGKNPLDAIGKDLKDVAGKVKGTISDAGDALTEEGLKAVNRGRGAIGKRSIGKSSAPTQKTGEATKTSELQTDTPSGSNQLSSGEQDTLDDITPEAPKPLFDLDNEAPARVIDPFEGDPAVADIVDDIASGKTTLFHGLIKANMRGVPNIFKDAPAGSRPLEADDDALDSLAPMRGQMEKEDSKPNTEPVQETGDEQAVEPDKPDIKEDDPNLKKVASGTGDEIDTGEDVAKGLATTAEDIEVAGGGIEDPITDVISAIVGIASAIEGASGEDAKTPTNVVNPSVQYGV